MAELPSPTHIHTLPWLQELLFTSGQAMGNSRLLVAKIRKYFGESEIELFYPPSFSNLFHPYITMFLGETVTLTPGIVSKYFCTSTLLDSLVAAQWAVLTHYSVYNSSYFRVSILCSQNVSVAKSDQNFKDKYIMYVPASSLVLYCKGWSFVVQCAVQVHILVYQMPRWSLLKLVLVLVCQREQMQFEWRALCAARLCALGSGSPSQPGSQGKLLVNMSTTTTTLSHIQ